MAIGQVVSTMFAPWLPTAVIIFGFMVALIASVYVISGLLMNDKMKMWAKMELIELFYSVLLITLAVIAVPYIDSVVQGALNVANPMMSAAPGATSTISLSPGPTPTYAYVRTGPGEGPSNFQAVDICGAQIGTIPTPDFAQDTSSDPGAPVGSVYSGVSSCSIRLGIWYMSELFQEEKNLAFKTYLDYISASMKQQFTVNVEFITETAGFLNFNPWAGFFAVGNGIRSTVFDWCIKLMMLANFQETILYFIATGLFPIMFIMGAILRAFNFTRKLGGLMLGLSLSLYFVFPTFYAFAALNMLQIKNSLRAGWEADTNANPYGNPDPPIGDLTYLNGTYVLPGANGAVNEMSVQETLLQDEYGSRSNFLDTFEDPTSGFSPTYRVGGAVGTTDYSTPAQQSTTTELGTLTAMSNTFQSWIDTVSGFAKYDVFMDRAFVQGGPIDSVARLTFWSLFFSLLSVLATIAAARSLSVTFGGDVEIAGLTRLI